MRLTVRARLTLVYGGLFVAAGVALLGVTYLLVARRVPDGATFSVTHGDESHARLERLAGDTWAEALNALVAGGGVALVGVSALALAAGWLVAGRLLRPLHRVTETARRIVESPARGLHERIALVAPHDDLKELADTFDVMVERLDRSFAGQRRFIANVSHELRTPLAVNRALIEVAVARQPEMREVGTTLLDVIARHERLIDGLLLLARSEHEVSDRAYVDLADLVEGLPVEVSAGPAPTTGNAALLERLVHNLVDNAMEAAGLSPKEATARYNVDGGWVRVTTGTRADGRAVLEVANTGPVIPGYEIPGLFEPFRRYPPDRRAGGAGLGLSIVAAIATAHGGEVRADPRPGGGLVVTVVLPGPAIP